MKKLLNTLFVTTQGVYLHKEGEAVAVRNGDAAREVTATPPPLADRTRLAPFDSVLTPDFPTLVTCNELRGSLRTVFHSTLRLMNQGAEMALVNPLSPVSAFDQGGDIVCQPLRGLA